MTANSAPRTARAILLGWFFHQPARHLSFDFVLRRLRLVGGLLVRQELTIRICLTAGTAIRGGKVEMDLRVVRLHFRGGFQRGRSFRGFVRAQKSPSQAEVGLSETGIQFSGAGEMGDGILPLLGSFAGSGPFLSSPDRRS